MRSRARSLISRLAGLTGPVAPLALALVLVFVCAVAVWSAVVTTRGVDVVDRTAELNRLYDRASVAVANEKRAEAAYLRQTAPHLRDEYNLAAAELTEVLDRLERQGGVKDRATARRIGARHRAYVQLAARRLAAADRGDIAASRLDAERATKLYEDVEWSVQDAARSHREEARRSLGELRVSSSFVARWVPVVGAVGILLVAFFSSMMLWYRRLMKQATAREIARLEHEALVDNLTGLSNHRALYDALPAASRRATAGTAVAIAAFDLDGLKLINDTRGHNHGDELIRRFADGVRATLPDGGRAFRVGGDEFVLILDEACAADAFHYVQELQAWLAPPAEGIRARDVGSDFEPTHVTAGVAELVGSADEADGVFALQRADLALIEAKRNGNRVLIWSPGIEAVARGGDQTPDHRRFLATALAKAVDAKDSYTRSHCETVSQLCVLIAEQLGFSPDDTERLRLAGLLHDVGKIGVPDSILQKPDQLTDEEFAEMQGHSTLGASIVAAAQLDDEATWVRHHHERIDGRGYPDRLEGDDIPLQSRIIFVADAYEAITSDRPYRAGRDPRIALDELRRCAGTQFDPDCVAALEAALALAGPGAVTPASTVTRLRAGRAEGTGAVPDSLPEAA